MKKVWLGILICGFFLLGCSTIERTFEAVKPIAIEQGIIAADAYIDGLVAEGKITAEQAAVLKEAARAAVKANK